MNLIEQQEKESMIVKVMMMNMHEVVEYISSRIFRFLDVVEFIFDCVTTCECKLPYTSIKMKGDMYE